MKTALFIDFDDSFSYNVVQELENIGIKVKVINWLDFEELPNQDLLVLGPGPGRPEDYQRIFPLIASWLSEKQPLFAVCLGHQIFWTLLGEEVVRSKWPVHGQKVNLHLNAEWRKWLQIKNDVFVQRYNSLCVPEQASLRNPYLKNFIQDGEILITTDKNVISYQFHPESLGTSFRRCFFAPITRDLI